MPLLNGSLQMDAPQTDSSQSAAATAPANASWVGLSLRQPDDFDFENAGSWPTWLSLFEDYVFVSGLHQALRDIQDWILLYCMSLEALPVLATFGLDMSPKRLHGHMQ